MNDEIDPTNWNDCKAPVTLPDNWKGKWRISPDGLSYHLTAERYFPGRGTWHQEVVISKDFLDHAAGDPGMAVAGFLYTMVPNTKQTPFGIEIHEN